MGTNHDYRLKDKDKWTKKEFQKIFSHSNLIWPSNTFGGRGAPTHLTRVYIEVRTPYDGIVLEGIINKLGRKGIALFQEATHVSTLSGDERGMFGKNFTELIPDRVTLDLNTEKMSELKEIIDDLQNAKEKVQEFTGIKGIGTKSKLFQLRHTSMSLTANYFTSGYLGDKLSDFYDKKNIVPVFEQYKEFVDPEYLTDDLDRVNRLFSALVGGGFDAVAMYVHDKIAEYKKKKKQQSEE